MANDYVPCCRDLFIYIYGKLVIFLHQEGRATTTGRQRLLIPYCRLRNDPERRTVSPPIPWIRPPQIVQGAGSHELLQ